MIVTAILEPAPDGTIHLPLTPEMRTGKIKVVATFIPVPDEGARTQSGVKDWLCHAKGSARLAPGESVDEARMSFYAAKFGI